MDQRSTSWNRRGSGVVGPRRFSQPTCCQQCRHTQQPQGWGCKQLWQCQLFGHKARCWSSSPVQEDSQVWRCGNLVWKFSIPSDPSSIHPFYSHSWCNKCQCISCHHVQGMICTYLHVFTLYTRPIWYLSEANDPWKWLSLSRPLVCNELPWPAPSARALAKCDANCIFPISISSLYSAHAQTHAYSYQEKKGHDNATRWLLFFPWYQGFAHPVNSTPTFFVC